MFQLLHFAIIFQSENVKYTHLLERALPSENKQIKCGIFIIWDLDSFILLCIPLLLDGNSTELVQHCWVFYQMDTRYESGLSFSQGLNVCVGLHVAYLETTQVP